MKSVTAATSVAAAVLAAVAMSIATPATEAKAASQNENIRELCYNGAKLNQQGISAHSVARSYVRSEGHPSYFADVIISQMESQCPYVF